MFVSKTNVHIWKDNKYKHVDKILAQNNFTLFELQWNNFTVYKNDINHFTWNGFKSFSLSLVDFIKSTISNKYCNINKPSILILSDSTIDYWNNKEENNNDKANNYIQDLVKDLLKEQNITISIDAVSGSGFCAMKNENKEIFLYD